MNLAILCGDFRTIFFFLFSVSVPYYTLSRKKKNEKFMGLLGALGAMISIWARRMDQN